MNLKGKYHQSVWQMICCTKDHVCTIYAKTVQTQTKWISNRTLLKQSSLENFKRNLWKLLKIMFFSQVQVVIRFHIIKNCIVKVLFFLNYFTKKTLYSKKPFKIDDTSPFSNQLTTAFSFACLAFSLTCISLFITISFNIFFRNQRILLDAFEHSESSKKFPKTETSFAAEVC